MLFAAETDWPEAAVAIAGIALVGSVIVVVVWQAMATLRTRLTVGRPETRAAEPDAEEQASARDAEEDR